MPDEPKRRTRGSFTVSHPAQTVFRVLGGQMPTGADAVARAALDAAREQRLASEARRAATRAARVPKER